VTPHIDNYNRNGRKRKENFIAELPVVKYTIRLDIITIIGISVL
jgi:hypothetical protein